MYLKSAKNIMVVYLLLMKYDIYFVKYIIHCDLRKFRYKLYIIATPCVDFFFTFLTPNNHDHQEQYVWNFQCYILKVYIQMYIVELMKMLTNLYPSIYWMKLEFIDSAVNYPWVEHSSGTIPMPTWITYVFDQQSILSDELEKKTEGTTKK